MASLTAPTAQGQYLTGHANVLQSLAADPIMGPAGYMNDLEQAAAAQSNAYNQNYQGYLNLANQMTQTGANSDKLKYLVDMVKSGFATGSISAADANAALNQLGVGGNIINQDGANAVIYKNTAEGNQAQAQAVHGIPAEAAKNVSVANKNGMPAVPQNGTPNINVGGREYMQFETTTKTSDKGANADGTRIIETETQTGGPRANPDGTMRIPGQTEQTPPPSSADQQAVIDQVAGAYKSQLGQDIQNVTPTTLVGPDNQQMQGFLGEVDGIKVPFMVHKDGRITVLELE